MTTLAENLKQEIIKSRVKGRVQSSIPADVLELLDVKPGDDIEWRAGERDGKVVVIANKKVD